MRAAAAAQPAAVQHDGGAGQQRHEQRRGHRGPGERQAERGHRGVEGVARRGFAGPAGAVGGGHERGVHREEHHPGDGEQGDAAGVEDLAERPDAGRGEEGPGDQTGQRRRRGAEHLPVHGSSPDPEPLVQRGERDQRDGEAGPEHEHPGEDPRRCPRPGRGGFLRGGVPPAARAPPTPASRPGAARTASASWRAAGTGGRRGQRRRPRGRRRGGGTRPGRGAAAATAPTAGGRRRAGNGRGGVPRRLRPWNPPPFRQTSRSAARCHSAFRGISRRPPQWDAQEPARTRWVIFPTEGGLTRNIGLVHCVVAHSAPPGMIPPPQTGGAPTCSFGGPHEIHAPSGDPRGRGRSRDGDGGRPRPAGHGRGGPGARFPVPVPVGRADQPDRGDVRDRA